ncbi:LysE family translocator [Thaumasiovibrio subtropicus]|uniref:LysE family translocator n=1 Tax=Thaumasiovibrio subtropicus TaxID=1891207 RepID=UPI000B353BE9|nr:LysE family translocator [Thaumasiovibrio subtropicus]
MEFQTVLLFILASLSINLIPGPDVVYIVSNTMRGDFKAGIKASLGLGAGYLVHTVAAVFGLSALIVSSAFAFSVIKYLGAAYLLYLGITALRNAIQGRSQFSITTHDDQKAQRVFRQGVIVSVLNPKVALFFLSFLPQFIDVTSGAATQELMMLGLLFSLLATGCNLTYALLGNLIFSSAKAKQLSGWIEGASGVLLIGLAGKIAFSRN